MDRLIRAGVLFIWLSLGVPPVRAQKPGAPIVPGTRIESLTVGATTYRQVQVRSVNARTLLITHTGGMASIHLRDLSPEWQARLRYDPVAEAAADAALQNAPPVPARVVPQPKPPAAKSLSAFDALLQKFGQPAPIRPDVDLRPKFFQLELGVKNQGRRPSCSVFAIVSALELQNAELTGKVEKFSEEYLIWAVRKSLRRMPAPAAVVPTDPNTPPEEKDEGFSLYEVVEALRAYGIPLQSTMPNTFGRRIDAIEDPPPAIVLEASNRHRVFVHQLPGRDGPTLVNNLVHALNAGLPVPVGMAWPDIRIPHGFISSQKPTPGSGHAVTMVGYTSTTGRIEDAVFIFKNSWGPAWGQGGYGTVTYSYLQDCLTDGVLLEVQADKAS